MRKFNLCVAWDWEYDADFVSLVADACRDRGVSLLEVTPQNMRDIMRSLEDQTLSFETLLDRASDSDESFLPLVEWARLHAVRCINPHERAHPTWDKAFMHTELVVAGIDTPPTIVLAPYSEHPTLPPLDLAPLGECFTIKPAHGAGSAGVILQATSLQQIDDARQQNPDDTYLLQSHVAAATLDDRPAWFRPIYCTGKVYSCWWHPSSHRFEPVSEEDESRHSLHLVRQMVQAISDVCRLDLFSSEIALTQDGHLMAIDYVNDILDLRVQSKAYDGVPDDIVRDLANRLVCLASGVRATMAS